MTTEVIEGVCHSCGEESTLSITDFGLRCDTCHPSSDGTSYQKPTYAPSLRKPLSDEFSDKLKKAEDLLPHKSVLVDMNDGSILQMSTVHSYAFELYEEDEATLLNQIAEETESCFEGGYEPGIEYEEVMFGQSEHPDSQSSYNSHAELAPLVVFKLLTREIHRVVFLAHSDSHQVESASGVMTTPSSSTISEAKSIHNKLMYFTSECEETVSLGDETVTVYHTQFGTYNTHNVLETLAERTETSPSQSSEFSSEAVDAIKHSTEHLGRKKREFYKPREYVEEQTLKNAASDYYLSSSTEDKAFVVVGQTRDSRLQEIADVLTLYNISVAERHWNSTFPDAPLRTQSGSSEDVNPRLLRASLLSVVDRLHGRTHYERPDPSLHTVEVLTSLYEEYDLYPTVRDLYAAFISTENVNTNELNSASEREVKSATLHGFSRISGLGGSQETGKWKDKRNTPENSQ